MHSFFQLYHLNNVSDFEPQLQVWCDWIASRELPEMIKVKRMVERHWDGIVRWQDYNEHNAVFMRRYKHWRRYCGIARTRPFNRLKAWIKNKVESLIHILHAMEMKNHATMAKFT